MVIEAQLREMSLVNGLMIINYHPFIHLQVLSDEDFKPEKLYTGEPARLNSLKTQRPPFDVKNPYMAPIKVSRYKVTS